MENTHRIKVPWTTESQEGAAFNCMDCEAIVVWASDHIEMAWFGEVEQGYSEAIVQYKEV